MTIVKGRISEIIIDGVRYPVADSSEFDLSLGTEVDRMKTLSEKQSLTLEFVRTYIEQNDRAPTFKEVADNFGITVHAADMRLRQCRSKGFLSWQRHTPRSIVLTRGSDESEDPIGN